MTKTISLSDDAYELLASVKQPAESFSDVARRLAQKEREQALFDPDVRVDLSEREAREWSQSVRRERDRSDSTRARVEFDSG